MQPGRCVYLHRLVSASVMAVFIVLSSSGCVRWASMAMYAMFGNQVDAAFDGLKEKRVAVVCVSDSAYYGPTAISYDLAVAVEKLLETNVDDIEVISQDVLDDWKDQNDWDEVDFEAIGNGLRDLVLLN